MLQPMSEETALGPAHDSRGVDLTLVQWMLELTPAERIEHIQDLADSLDQIRELNGQPEPD